MLAEAARGCELEEGEAIAGCLKGVFQFLSKEIRIKLCLSCTIAWTSGMQ
jgi:hypothetical protein